ncbi:MAG: ATP synthase F1 subunit gamma [Ammonifex sp.]|nr:MAG: ATP synthase F1 subunit gamma [Ammonifex sp.]
MPGRREIKDRIRGIRSIEQITRALKAVSMAKAARAQAAVQAARPYDRMLREVVGLIAGAAHQARHPLLETRAVNRACLVVVSADRGLSGAFDVPILRRALEESGAFPAAVYVAVGRKAASFLNFRGLELAGTFVDLDENVHIRDARSIARHVITGYERGDFDRADLVYSEFVNFFEHRTTVAPLIPVPIKEETARNYIFEPEAEAVLEAVLPLFIKEAVFHALTESKASEHSARLAAMDGATRNAGEMIDRLTLQLHRARQAAVTGELLEIIPATAALE